MKKRKHIHEPYKRREPTTEKEIIDAIKELEYQRIKLPHLRSEPQFGSQNIRIRIAETSIGEYLNKLKVKLENIKIENKTQ